MGAASYVGRVGGLAVALGVGTAIATGYGVASADTTASSPPPSTNSSTTEPSTPDTGPVDPTATPDVSESETTTETKTTTTVAEGLVTHLTSLVLVDEAGATQEGIPASRKIALPTPRTAMAMALPPPTLLTSVKRTGSSFSFSMICSMARPNMSLPPPGPA